MDPLIILKSRSETLCWWIGAAIYFLSAYLLYDFLKQFPSFMHNYGEVIFASAWIPLGVLAFWIKNKIESWLLEGL